MMPGLARIRFVLVGAALAAMALSGWRCSVGALRAPPRHVGRWCFGFGSWCLEAPVDAAASVGGGDRAADVQAFYSQGEEGEEKALEERPVWEVGDWPAYATVPRCPNMLKVDFVVRDFRPIDTFKELPAGSLTVHGCSNAALGASEGRRGVVLFMHGSGDHADDYARLYPNRIHRPEDFDVIFLQSPRPGSHWMALYQKDTLDHHWVNDQVLDDMAFVEKIVDQLAALYGGHQKVWLAGFSQGAVLAASVALRGSRALLGGAFVVAGYPPRPLYTNHGGVKPRPSNWSAADIDRKKQTKIYFLTGALDTVLPWGKAFCKFNKVVEKYGLDPANYRFWIKKGFCHYDGDHDGRCHKRISPHGGEFEVLWNVVEGTPDNVTRVVDIEPRQDCKAEDEGEAEGRAAQ